MAQGLVEDDGGAVGEVESADAVVVRVDEVAADILSKDGFVAVLGMPERLLVGLPGVGVFERVAIAQHGDALAALGRRGKQWLGNPRALAAKDQKVTVAVGTLRIGAARLFGQQMQAFVGGERPLRARKSSQPA